MDHDRHLRIAVEEAERALAEGASPFGAVIVGPDGSILSRGRNQVLSGGDQTAHAEVDAIRAGGAAIARPPAGGGWTLYASGEPCLMCLGAILLCPIDTLVWAAGSRVASAYATILTGAYRADRVGALRVVTEPVSALRDRCHALIDAFERGARHVP
ncbi:MAG: nucleoside deaminase [Armatimonadetes bacterium]|nr:nucleoside deaminase [Armatimonadota bacterium]